MKWVNRLMVVLYCLVAALPIVAMKLKWGDRPIFGVLPPAPAPDPSFTALRSEQFQIGFTSWFENALGFKGYELAIDNTLLYHAFRDTKFGSAVGLGAGGYLFKDEDLAFFNKTDTPSQAQVDSMADRIAAMQTRMRVQHRAFVPLIIPSKTSVWREHVPPRWTRELGEPRPTDTLIYRALVQALDARHVIYVDARAMFAAGKLDRKLLWGADARHWSFYGACVAMVEVVRAYHELSGKPALDYQCPLAEKRVSHHDDYDLWGLLNAWGIAKRPPRVPVVVHHAPPAASDRPTALFIGTSFQWTTMKDAEQTGLFSALNMDSYNKVLVTWPQNIGEDVHPHGQRWRDLFMTRDLYVLDLFETYLFAPNTYVDQTLEEIGAELDAAAAATAEAAQPPTPGVAIGSINDLGVTDGRHYFELWGAFPRPAEPYQAVVTCDGIPMIGTVYYQNANSQQLNIHIKDPGVGSCDQAQSPPRASGVSCTFQVRQGSAVRSPALGPRRVCPGPQGKSGQDPDGRCSVGLAGC